MILESEVDILNWDYFKKPYLKGGELELEFFFIYGWGMNGNATNGNLESEKLVYDGKYRYGANKVSAIKDGVLEYKFEKGTLSANKFGISIAGEGD